MSILAWIVLGLISGFIGSKLVNKTRSRWPRRRIRVPPLRLEPIEKRLASEIELRL